MVIVGRQGQLEALQIHKSRWYRTRYLAMSDLVGEVDISDAEGEVSHVVPHLGHRVGLLGGVQGPLSIMS